jgi:hypothetical protein
MVGAAPRGSRSTVLLGQEYDNLAAAARVKCSLHPFDAL